MFKHARIPTLLAAFILLLVPRMAGAQMVLTTTNQPVHGVCGQAVLPVCGAQLRIDPSPVGAITTVQMPEQFVTKSFLVQCVEGRAGPYYAVLQANDSLCELKTCKAGSRVSVCGSLSLPIDKEAQIGQEIKVQAPTDLLIESKKGSNSNFTAKCMLNDGGASYMVSSTAGLSCNDFLCEPTVLHICNDTVQVRGPGELGEVNKMITEAGRTVMVECLSSGGKRPSYVVVDRAQEVCD